MSLDAWGDTDRPFEDDLMLDGEGMPMDMPATVDAEGGHTMTTPLDTAPIVARLAGYQQYAEGRTVLGLRARYIDDVGALLGEIERLQTSVENVLMAEMRASRARAREGPAAARIEQTTQWTIERIRQSLGIGHGFLREE